MNPYNVTIQRVSPETAKAWLATSRGNRKIKAQVIKRYADDMRRGRWDERNGATIVFDSNDILRDGHHRLNALIMAGVTLSFLVVGGASASSQATLDIGTIRTFGDRTEVLEGKRTSQDYRARAQVLRALRDCGFGALLQCSFWAEHEYIARCQTELQWAEENFTGRFDKIKRRLTNRGVAGAWAYAWTIGPEVASYLPGFLNGSGFAAVGDPILTLRNYFLGRDHGNSLAVAESDALCTLRALWAAYHGEQLLLLRVSNEGLKGFARLGGVAVPSYFGL